MIFLKHVQHKLDDQDNLQSILARVRETAARVPGVSLRDFFILQERDELILVMNCPDETAYQEWRELCPPPPGAKDWVDSAVLPDDFGKDVK